jgi:hypothetical protein
MSSTNLTSWYTLGKIITWLTMTILTVPILFLGSAHLAWAGPMLTSPGTTVLEGEIGRVTFTVTTDEPIVLTSLGHTGVIRFISGDIGDAVTGFLSFVPPTQAACPKFGSIMGEDLILEPGETCKFLVGFTTQNDGPGDVVPGIWEIEGRITYVIPPDDPDGPKLSLISTAQVTVVDVIPEPSTYLLFGTGLLGILGYGWRKRKQAV